MTTRSEQNSVIAVIEEIEENKEMSQELKLGKYEFFPYTDDKGKPLPTVEELLEFLRSPAKAKCENDVKTSSRSIDRHRPLRKRRG